MLIFLKTVTNTTVCTAEENMKADEPKAAEPSKKAEEAPHKTEDPPKVSLWQILSASP